jgi:hypothetical protein
MTNREINTKIAEILGWTDIIPALTGDTSNYPPSGLEGTDPRGNKWEWVPEFTNNYKAIHSAITCHLGILSNGSIFKFCFELGEDINGKRPKIIFGGNLLISKEDLHNFVFASPIQLCRAFLKVSKKQ